jgi:SAM-dependent methyltransferase
MGEFDVAKDRPEGVRIRFGKITGTADLPFYNQEARSDQRKAMLRAQLHTFKSLPGQWATPLESWIDATYDSAAQAEGYEHVRPKLLGGDVMQLGGSGRDALKALLGGARRGYLVTPIKGEADLASDLAKEFGLEDRFEALLGTGEQIPLSGESVDAIVSGGCLHHTKVTEALLDVRRVLRPGGRFAAWDPWHARLYDLGISVFGKREAVMCHPLDPIRLADLIEVFPVSELRLHGALTRYPAIVLCKFGVHPSIRTLHKMTLLDDRVSNRIPALRRNGSSVAVLTTK